MAFLTEDGAPLGYGYGGGKTILSQVAQVDEHQGVALPPPTKFGSAEEAAAEFGLNIQPDYKAEPLNDGARWLAG